LTTTITACGGSQSSSEHSSGNTVESSIELHTDAANTNEATSTDAETAAETAAANNVEENTEISPENDAEANTEDNTEANADSAEAEALSGAELIAVTHTIAEFQAQKPAASTLICDPNNIVDLSVGINILNNLSQQQFAQLNISALNNYANYHTLSLLALTARGHSAAMVEQLG